MNEPRGAALGGDGACGCVEFGSEALQGEVCEVAGRDVDGEVDGGEAGAGVAVDGDRAVVAVENDGRADGRGEKFCAERGDGGLRDREAGGEVKRELLRNVGLVRTENVNHEILR